MSWITEMTTVPGKKRAEIERLETVIDVYGGDRDRWPAAERLALARLLTSDPEARKILAEARALDRVLDAAPALPRVAQEALARSIVTSARTEGRQSQAEASATSRRSLGSGNILRSPRPWSRPPMSASGAMRSAALLAASLVLGVLAGATFLSGELQGTATIAGMTQEEMLQHQFMRDDDNLDAIEEELI